MVPSNNSDFYLLSYISTNTILTFVGPAVGLISSISCLIVLNAYLKKLHSTFKTLINIVLIHNILALAASILLLTSMFAFEYQTFLVCSLLQITIASSIYLTKYGIALMSFMRFHIAEKTSKAESTKKYHCYMISLIILYIVFDYFSLGPMSFFVVLYFRVPSGAANCAGALYDGPSILPLFHFVKILIIVIVGIRYDFLMMNFLKKRNSKNGPGQVRLVPWKSGNEEIDLNVPVSATVSSVIGGIAALGLAICYVKSFQDIDYEAWKYISFGLTLNSSLEMPIMIGLTIRAAKHHKPSPKIPKGPMFHDPDIESTSEHEEVQVSNGEAIVQQPTFPKTIHVLPLKKILNDVESQV